MYLVTGGIKNHYCRMCTANISLGEDNIATWSISWVSLSIVALVGGFFTPLIRFRWLRKLAPFVGNQLVYEREIQELGVTQSQDVYKIRKKALRDERYKMSSNTFEELFKPPSQSNLHRVDDEESEDAVSEGEGSEENNGEQASEDNSKELRDKQSRQKDVNAGARRKSLSERYQPGKVPLPEMISKYYLFEYDIEIMVRSLLAEPTRENFTQATTILNAALKAYPESVYVRIIYSSIILTYASNSDRAISLLQEAQGLPAPLDLKFLLFSKIHAWNQIRQNENMGTGKDMVSVIQFKKHLKEATQEHAEAIKQISKFWSMLDSEQHDSLATSVRKIASHRDEAEKAYLQLLEKYPTNKMIMRSYGLFCVYVKNENGLAEVYLKKANNTGSNNQGSQADTSHGGDSSSFGGGSSSMGGSSMAEMRKRASNRRLEIKHGEYTALRKLRIGFWVAIATLVALTIGMLVGSTQLLERFNQNLDALDEAGTRRTGTVDVGFYARQLHLAAVNGDAQRMQESREEILRSAERLHENHQIVYCKS